MLKMKSPSLLLFAAVLCFAVYSCVGTKPPVVPKQPCEYKAIKQCNYQFKKVFQDAKAAARQGTLGLRLERTVYCRALQTFMNCLEQSLLNCSGGAWLPEYSFVVLEHGVMDKKCGVCPGHQFEYLENALNASSKQEYVGSDVCPRCAKHVHKKCVKRFLDKMKADSNMCNDVQEFIACYKEEGDPDKPCAAVSIVKKFANLCRQLGERMLKQDKIHPGLMC